MLISAVLSTITDVYHFNYINLGVILFASVLIWYHKVMHVFILFKIYLVLLLFLCKNKQLKDEKRKKCI